MSRGGFSSEIEEIDVRRMARINRVLIMMGRVGGLPSCIKPGVRTGINKGQWVGVQYEPASDPPTLIMMAQMG